MSDISPINPSRLARTERVRPGESRQADTVGDDPRAHTPRGADRVDLSSPARLLATLKAGLPERTDLIERVKGEIAEGTYDTPEKFDAAVDAIKQDLELDLG